jgi:hypothetical protein
MDLPESAGADDTTAGQDRDHGRAGPDDAQLPTPRKSRLEFGGEQSVPSKQKGRPEGRPFRE